MIEITVPLAARSYRVLIADGTLSALGELVRAHVTPAPTALALIADRQVASLHGAAALAALASIDVPRVTITTPQGEVAKQLAVYGEVLEQLAAARLDRGALIVALGGGVVGDLAGFAAATYLRGIRFVSVPTTLLAQVDAAVGGKTGINLGAGKNLAGAFHQPSLVVIDPSTLATLPRGELNAGMGEVLKYGLMAEPAILASLEAPAPPEWPELIARCVRIKARVVQRDEREGGERAHLNLGHTFAHAIERAQDYGGLRHGEAVGLGLVAACHLSHRLLGCDPGLTPRMRALLERQQLPTRVAVPVERVLPHLGADKKRHGAELRLVLLERLGVPRVVRAPDAALLREALELICG
ncbi:MAG: 3-dehydroquinate synthase [Planctomycetota bacterium]